MFSLHGYVEGTHKDLQAHSFFWRPGPLQHHGLRIFWMHTGPTQTTVCLQLQVSVLEDEP